ncbi:MAG: HD-GYP domain-containing protein, partial [Rhodoferax sp.]
MAVKKIGIKHLRVGMYIHSLGVSWMENPFWRTKFVITDPADVRLIVDRGIKEVWIDVDKGLDVAAGAASQQAAETEVDAALMDKAATTGTSVQTAPPERVPMAEEVKLAARICAHGKSAVVLMFQEVRMGKAISAEAVSELVDEISSSVMRNPGALISLARLKTADDYTYMHSVAVCALMVALARQLGLDQQQTHEAGISGLLHDLGKALMPMELLNKPGKLTNEEFAIIKSHPVEGHRLLVEGGTAGPILLDVCLHHHERVDGSGYPERLKDEQISQFAKMGAICDVYDAITSNRPYKAGWDPAEAIHKMTGWCNGHFD